MSHPAPRRHAVKLRHGFVFPAIAVPPAPTFALALHCAVCPPPAPSASLMASSATLVDAQLARRTASEPALRGRRAESAHRLRSSACAASGWLWAASAPLARSLAGCAGGQWVATPLLDLLHSVARRRLPVVKRTAAIPGRVGLQDQNRATCCIAHPFGGYAANPAASHLIPAPFRRSHTAKANPLRGIASQKQTRSALRVCWLESIRVLAALDCTPPGRGKFAAARRALT